MADAIMLTDRVAIITGGAGGIGGATARLMAARGGKVAVADLDLGRAEAVAAEIGPAALPVHLDLGDEASVVAMVHRTVEHFGRLDILVNNASLGAELNRGDVDIETMDTELWDLIFRVNLRGHMIACRQALPHLASSGAGSIVNVVSNLAIRGHVSKAAYAASKAAMLQMTLSLAASHGRKNVRANAVAPGFTATPAALAGVPQAFVESTLGESLLPKLGVAEDLAEVIAFMASDSARNVTGQLLVADAGLTSHLAGMAGALART